MAEKSNIGWTDSTVNFWRGCTKISPGCLHCYAEYLTMNRMGGGKYVRGEPRVKFVGAVKSALAMNRKPFVCDDCGGYFNESETRKTHAIEGATHCCSGKYHRRRIFTNSLSDMFDAEVPIEMLAEALDTIRQCQNVDWLVLTKRPHLCMAALQDAQLWVGDHYSKTDSELFSWLEDWLTGNPPHNVWFGFSGENNSMLWKRWLDAKIIPAKQLFISIEPLLEDVSGTLETVLIEARTIGIKPLVIVGGESGAEGKRRDCGVVAIENVARQCVAANVSCFVKQDCAFKSGEQGRISDELWQLKQFPEASVRL